MRIDLEEGEKLYICDFCGMSSKAAIHMAVAVDDEACICEECCSSAIQVIEDKKASKEAA